MHELFPAYYDLSDGEINRLWQEGIFVFDTNMLLNVYRYTDETRERFFEILDMFKNRIWIPFQVALEYQDSRVEVIEEQVKAYSVVSQAFKDAIHILDRLNALKRKHSFINVEELTEAPRKALKAANDQLTQELTNYKTEYERLKVIDEHRAKITQLFQGKIGSPYDREKMLEFYQQADKRFELQILPGYKDKRKKEYNKYGDVVLWFQLIDYARSQIKPIIFVTDDVKSDWYISREESKTSSIRPRPELVQEMYRETGVLLQIYQGYDFFEQATKFLSLKPEPDISEDVKAVSERYLLDAVRKRLLEQFRETEYGLIKEVEFPQSVLSLKETLDRYGEAQTDAEAWGYSPSPIAERLADGKIEVTTYHFEGEYRKAILDNETDVVDYLYDDGDGCWYPGEWHQPR